MPTHKAIDPLSRPSQPKRPVEQTPAPQKSSAPLLSRDRVSHKQPSFTRVVSSAWLSSWRPEVFHLSLLRTLFSLRPFLFSIFPVIFFQLTGSLALRSEQALSKLRTITGSEQTSNYILAGGILLALLCVSWFADMVVAPALAKLANARLDNRRLSGTRALLNSVSEMNQTIITRLLHGVGLAIWLIFSALILLVAQQLAVGSREQITYGLIAILISVLLLAFHEVARWLSQNYVATSSSLGGGLTLTLRNVFRKLFRKLGYGLSWLFGLGLYLALSIGLVWLEINLLSTGQSFGLSIVYLALVTTALYLLWTNWVAFSNNYWATLTLKRTPPAQLAHILRNSERVEQFRIWPILVVITVLVVLVLGYFFFMITNVDIVIHAFSGFSAALPKNLQILLPKP